MIGNVAQFIGVLDRIAPVHLAEAWDNVGLQVGDRNWPVKKIWTALDPLPEVVAHACDNDVDLLVTHHPLLFKPIKQIDCETPLGRSIQRALSSQMAVFSAHTNLDSVSGGVNDALAERIGMLKIRVLSDPIKSKRYKLVVFVPSTHVKAIVDALVALNIGCIENYSGCTFRCEGMGTFFAGADASPTAGTTGILNDVKEHRIEVLVKPKEIDMAIAAVKRAHPYESMAYDVYPLADVDQYAGLGRVGELSSSMPLGDFAKKLKTVLNIEAVKVVGNLEERINSVAVCTGSGSSLLGAALESGAQVYVSGDLGYHTARDAQQAGMGLVDIGHFGSERLIVDVLAASIRDASKALALDVVVEAANIETDPFHHL